MLPEAETCDRWTATHNKLLEDEQYLAEAAIDAYIDALDALGGTYTANWKNNWQAYYKDLLQKICFPTTGTQEGVRIVSRVIQDLLGVLSDLIRPEGGRGSGVEVTIAEALAKNSDTSSIVPLTEKTYRWSNNSIHARWDDDAIM